MLLFRLLCILLILLLILAFSLALNFDAFWCIQGLLIKWVACKGGKRIDFLSQLNTTQPPRAPGLCPVENKFEPNPTLRYFSQGEQLCHPETIHTSPINFGAESKSPTPRILGRKASMCGDSGSCAPFAGQPAPPSLVARQSTASRPSSPLSLRVPLMHFVNICDLVRLTGTCTIGCPENNQ